MKSPFGSTGGNNLPSSLFLNSKCHRLFIAVFRRLFRFDITLVTTNADLIDKLTQQAMPVMHMPVKIIPWIADVHAPRYGRFAKIIR
ncbi:MULTISPECIES: hypothetical protein [unclassified Pseudomonas]|uniref:hypothetical protein n=1 Tax=unclassified Pseudomonas TaxID=196821 RepID=UPI0008CDE265|nr:MULTISPECIES: hypothetical protein [unclassified Pseudomonas]OHC26035.1 MAG: hypothetical protein A3J25_03100 [Pseudomonadales bacterium RIFCSPLOWO2_02_FULL_63_210]